MIVSKYVELVAGALLAGLPPMTEEQIASSNEAKSQKYPKDDSKNTTRRQPVPNRQVSRR
jgi:hypothetical protein